jgi:hypothetical protein
MNSYVARNLTGYEWAEAELTKGRNHVVDGHTSNDSDGGLADCSCGGSTRSWSGVCPKKQTRPRQATRSLHRAVCGSAPGGASTRTPRARTRNCPCTGTRPCGSPGTRSWSSGTDAGRGGAPSPPVREGAVRPVVAPPAQAATHLELVHPEPVARVRVQRRRRQGVVLLLLVRRRRIVRRQVATQRSEKGVRVVPLRALLQVRCYLAHHHHGCCCYLSRNRNVDRWRECSVATISNTREPSRRTLQMFRVFLSASVQTLKCSLDVLLCCNAK